MNNLVKYRIGERSKIRFIRKRVVRDNSNHLELFVGASGSGKTWSSLSDAHNLDSNFNVEKQLVFDFKSFMNVINSDWFKKLKIRIIIFDEPQISISNRSWQSLVNKLMNYVLTTFRHQNIIVFFCCPYEDFLDSASMKMIHAKTEMVSIDKKKKQTKTKFRLLQYNSRMKKFYTHCLYVNKNKNTNPLMFDYINKPPQEMIDTYERMKTEFTFKLNKDIEVQLDKLEQKNKPQEEIESEFKGKGTLSTNQLNVLDCWKEGIFNRRLIGEKCTKAISCIVASEKSMKKKGFFKESYMEIYKKQIIATKDNMDTPNLNYKEAPLLIKA